MQQHTNNPGGIVEMSAPLNITNLALLDHKSGKPTRVVYREEK